MTIPRLAGIGDDLAGFGQSIGQSLHQILNPDDDMQKKLIAHLAANPGLIDELTQQEQTNPGSTGIFGKDAQKFFSGRQTTPEFQTKQKLHTAQADEAQQGVTLNAQQIAENQRKMQMQKDSDAVLADLAKTDPESAKEAAKYRAYAQNNLMSPEAISELKDHADQLKQRRKADATATAFTTGKTPDQIYAQVNGTVDPRTGKELPPTATVDEIGAIRSSPSTQGYIQYEMERRARESQDAAMARERGMIDYRTTKDEEARKIAQKRIDEADKKMNTAEIAKINTQLIGIANKVNSGGPGKSPLESSQAEPDVQLANQLLQKRAEFETKLTGKPVAPGTAEFVDRTGNLERLKNWATGKSKESRPTAGLTFNINGKKTTDPYSAASGPVTLSPNAKEALSQVQKNPGLVGKLSSLVQNGTITQQEADEIKSQAGSGGK